MQDPLLADELEAVADIDIGEALRRTREYYGKSLDDVERALRIRACQIEAIENGDMQALPGRVYAIGFVRSYAEYLDLDGSKVVSLFRNQYINDQGHSALSFPMPASEAKNPTLWLVAITLIIAIAFVYIWDSKNQQDRYLVEQIKPLPDRIEAHVNEEIKSNILISKEIDEYTTYKNIADNIYAPVENMSNDGENKSGVILKILGDSWVEIKDDNGNIIVSRILESGDEYFVPDNPGLTMSLGNAANVEILVNGKALMPLGKSGDVRHNIPLNTSYLRTLDFREDEYNISLEENLENSGDMAVIEDMKAITGKSIP